MDSHESNKNPLLEITTNDRSFSKCFGNCGRVEEIMHENFELNLIYLLKVVFQILSKSYKYRKSL